MNINLGVYFEFNLGASVDYEYKTVKSDALIFTMENKEIKQPVYINQALKTEKNDLELAGNIYIEAGVRVAVSLKWVVPEQWLSVGAAAKVGVYAQADGAIYHSFIDDNTDDNYIRANYDIGIAIEINGYYYLGKRHDFSILDKKKISIVNGFYDDSEKIDNDARYYNGHYYKIFAYTCGTWEEAKSYCESVGGYLATISSANENQFLFEYMKSCGYDNAYFGMTDKDQEGLWKWSNGEAVDYVNFNDIKEAGDVEPNNSYEEDYAMFYWKYTDGKWNDGNYCSGTASDDPIFICEWNHKPD